MDRISSAFEQHPVVQRVLLWSKTHSLPGLKDIPVYHLVKFLYHEINNDELITRANSMAYSFFLAIFPGIIFMITLLPYMPYGDNFFVTLQESIVEVVPGEAGKWIFETVQDLLKNQRANLLSVGFLMTLWFSSNGMVSMMQGLSKNNPLLFRKRGFWEERITAFRLTFLMAFILFASVVMVIFGNILLRFLFQYIDADYLTKVVFWGFRWIVLLLLFYSGISFVYRYGVASHKKIHFINAGATVATVLSVGASWGFSFYADNFGTYNTVYGSIGTIIALLLWIQINCTILLIGFELNAGIAAIKAGGAERN